MRTARLACVLIGTLPCVLACSSRKGPEGDIGYGASDGIGNTGNDSSTGGTGNTGNKGNGSAANGGKNNGGTGNTGDAGDTGAPPGEEACNQFWTAQAPEADCDLDDLDDTGMTLGLSKGLYRSIEADTKLESGKIYMLDGPTHIESGVTLTIGKCTKILGMNEESVLVTESGLKKVGVNTYEPGGPPGKLVAVGEPNAPIIFTSSKKPGDRLRGDWGGIVLAGRAPDNYYSRHTPDIDGLAPFQIEGLEVRQVRSGWKDATYEAESSGHLEYVRIEFVGYVAGSDRELNGLTFAGAGSGTKISHVMVSNSIDDCFEWFGGSVNADHLIAHNCDDDAFDTDLGYRGKVQFAFTRQFRTTNEVDSNGFEWDGSGKDKKATPERPANPRFSNITACGGNTGKFTPNPRMGIVMRNASGGGLINTLMTGYETAAITVRNVPTATPPTINTTTLTYSTLWGNAALYYGSEIATLPTDDGTPPMWFEMQEGNSLEAPRGMCDCWANPPQPYALEKIEGTAPGEDYPEPSADYRGAFKDGAPESNWMSGAWVDWSDK
jgi:hypothetical protein